MSIKDALEVTKATNADVQTPDYLKHIILDFMQMQEFIKEPFVLAKADTSLIVGILSTLKPTWLAWLNSYRDHANPSLESMLDVALNRRSLGAKSRRARG